jgi:hypothetical protein
MDSSSTNKGRNRHSPSTKITPLRKCRNPKQRAKWRKMQELQEYTS